MDRHSVVAGPVSALSAAAQAFALVTAEPTNLYLDGHRFGADLPAGPIALPRLRDLLLHPSTSHPTRDAVWREMIGRAQRDRGTWVVVALGMAMPGLRRCLRQLRLGFAGDVDDLESEIAKGFVEALYRLDTTDSALCARLVRAARTAGRRLVYAEAAVALPRWESPESHAPSEPWGHPDLVLLGAVDAQVLSDQEARLIATTRLEGVPIGAVAVVIGERTNTLVQRRRRCEQRLAAALAEGRVTARSATPGTGWVPRSGV